MTRITLSLLFLQIIPCPISDAWVADRLVAGQIQVLDLLALGTAQASAAEHALDYVQALMAAERADVLLYPVEAGALLLLRLLCIRLLHQAGILAAGA